MMCVTSRLCMQDFVSEAPADHTCWHQRKAALASRVSTWSMLTQVMSPGAEAEVSAQPSAEAPASEKAPPPAIPPPPAGTAAEPEAAPARAWVPPLVEPPELPAKPPAEIPRPTLEGKVVAAPASPPSPFLVAEEGPEEGEEAEGEVPEAAAGGPAPGVVSTMGRAPAEGLQPQLAPLLVAKKSVLLGEPTQPPPATPGGMLRRLTSLGSAAVSPQKNPLARALGRSGSGRLPQTPRPLRQQSSTGGLLGLGLGSRSTTTEGREGAAAAALGEAPLAPLRTQKSLGVLLGIRQDPGEALSDDDIEHPGQLLQASDSDPDNTPRAADDAEMDPEKGMGGYSTEAGLLPGLLQRRSVLLGSAMRSGPPSPQPSARFSLRRLVSVVSGGFPGETPKAAGHDTAAVPPNEW